MCTFSFSNTSVHPPVRRDNLRARAFAQADKPQAVYNFSKPSPSASTLLSVKYSALKFAVSGKGITVDIVYHFAVSVSPLVCIVIAAFHGYPHLYGCMTYGLGFLQQYSVIHISSQRQADNECCTINPLYD